MTDLSTNQFSIGSRVLARYGGLDDVYEGVIDKIYLEGGSIDDLRLLITYDDGDIDSSALPGWIERTIKAGPETKYHIGEKVDCLWDEAEDGGECDYYPATIISIYRSQQAVEGDGVSYSVLYDDEDRREHVTFADLRHVSLKKEKQQMTPLQSEIPPDISEEDLAILEESYTSGTQREETPDSQNGLPNGDGALELDSARLHTADRPNSDNRARQSYALAGVPRVPDTFWTYIQSLKEKIERDNDSQEEAPISVLPQDRLTYLISKACLLLRERSESENRGTGMELELLLNKGNDKIQGHRQATNQGSAVTPFTENDRVLIDLQIRCLALMRICYGMESPEMIQCLCDLASTYLRSHLYNQAETTIKRAQYLHLKVARARLVQQQQEKECNDALEESLIADNNERGDDIQMRPWELPGLRSPSRNEPFSAEAMRKKEDEWKYKDLELTPRKAAQAVKAIMATLLLLITEGNQEGIVNVQDFLSRLRAYQQQTSHHYYMPQSYLDCFLKELQGILRRIDSPAAVLKWSQIIDLLRARHRLFQHSVRAAHYAMPLQDVALLRHVFTSAEGLNHDGGSVVDPKDLVAALRRDYMAVEAFAGLKLPAAIQSYTNSSLEENHSDCLPITWEETLVQFVTRSPQDILGKLRYRILSLKAEVHLNNGELKPAYGALLKALEELKTLHLENEVPAAHLYTLMARYWDAMAHGKTDTDMLIHDNIEEDEVDLRCLEKEHQCLSHAVDVLAVAFEWNHPQVAFACLGLAKHYSMTCRYQPQSDKEDQAQLWMVRALGIFQEFYEAASETPPVITVLSIQVGQELLKHHVLNQRLSGAEVIDRGLDKLMPQLRGVSINHLRPLAALY